MPQPDHPYFLGVRDFQWSAISSIATFLAVMVALAVPAVVAWRERCEQKRRRTVHFREAVGAIHSSFDCLTWAVADFELGKASAAYDLTRVAARAASRAETLRLLAQRTDLGDDAFSGCIAAAQSMDQVSAASKYPTQIDLIVRHLNAAVALATEAELRVSEVINGEKLVVSRRPALPLAPGVIVAG